MRHFLHLPTRAAGSLFTRSVASIFLIALFHFISLPLFAQSPIKGRVVASDGPVSGVTVTIKGTQTSTVTDENCTFSIPAADKSVLVFTHINYAAQEVTINGNLKEVIVIGYN